MKILYTSTSFFPAIGGAQLHWLEIAARLSARGHRTHVASQWDRNRDDWLLGATMRSPRSPFEYSVKQGAGAVEIRSITLSGHERLASIPWALSYHLMPTRSGHQLARVMSRALEEIAVQYQPDLVHNIRIGRHPLTEASLRLAERLDVPSIATPNYSPRMMTPFGRLFTRGLIETLRRASVIVVFTREEEQALCRLGIPRNRITRIGLGPLLANNPSPGRFRTRYGLGDHPIVLFLGQKLPYKGYDSLLHAAPAIWRSFADTHLVFIGPDSHRSLRLLRRHSDRRIVNIGAVEPYSDVKADAIAAADVVAVPSVQEGLGVVYIEAWAAKKPVIACDIPFVREIVRHGVNGLLISPHRRQDELAAAVCRLLRSPELRSELGERGYEEYASKYSWESAVDAIESAYRHL